MTRSTAQKIVLPLLGGAAVLVAWALITYGFYRMTKAFTV